jgi:putative ubiquitin-RnfH superfamily antitoxin RatB of RatAB toxin-antitoxin module
MSSAPEVGATVAIEVACALPERQLVVPLAVPAGTTALEAVALAGVAAAFPEVAIDPARIGIHGRLLGTRGLAPAGRYAVRAGDRVEVYRPLLADPKTARRRRAGIGQAASMSDSGTGTTSGVSAGAASGLTVGAVSGVSSAGAPVLGTAAPEGR